jgi:hypothetical protein
MLDGVFFGYEKIVGEGIGEDAIDFFGHTAVEAAEAGFDVGDGNAKLHSGERNGNSGIDVANDKNEIGLVFEQYGLDALENFSSLHGVRARTDFEIDERRGDAHLTEKNVGKGGVVMLTGVDEDGFNLWVALHLAHERRDFGEIGTCACYVYDFQWHGYERFTFESTIVQHTGLPPNGWMDTPFSKNKRTEWFGKQKRRRA